MLTEYRLRSLAYRASVVGLGGCGESPQPGLFLPAASGLGGTKREEPETLLFRLRAAQATFWVISHHYLKPLGDFIVFGLFLEDKA